MPSPPQANQLGTLVSAEYKNTKHSPPYHFEHCGHVGTILHAQGTQGMEFSVMSLPRELPMTSLPIFGLRPDMGKYVRNPLPSVPWAPKVVAPMIGTSSVAQTLFKQ